MVGGQSPSSGPVRLVKYDPAWPALFEREETRVRATLGTLALQIEHVGSTSVPGLAAKPVIDVVLVVDDSADETAYVPALGRQGYVLRIREPEWHQHRMLKGPDNDVNMHVFSDGCPEVERMLAFRDRIRQHPDDRDRYERRSSHWRLANGPSSRTTRTPRPRSSTRASNARRPKVDGSVDASERGVADGNGLASAQPSRLPDRPKPPPRGTRPRMEITRIRENSVRIVPE
jgi:GrpB-like predicted nucleotidyltransferase (UPF0157 family)